MLSASCSRLAYWDLRWRRFSAWYGDAKAPRRPYDCWRSMPTAELGPAQCRGSSRGTISTSTAGLLATGAPGRRFFLGEVTMSNSGRIIRVLAAALAFSAMASASAATIPLRAWLNGAQVPLAVGGTGFGTVSFDTVTKVLSWSVTYSGLSGPCTLSHFHGPASAGVNNFPVVDIACSASPLTGMAEVFARAIIRPALASTLMALIARWMLPAYERSTSMPHAASLLIGGVALGIAVYAGAAGLLWVVAGRPVSAERIVLERIRNTVSTFLSSH